MDEFFFNGPHIWSVLTLHTSGNKLLGAAKSWKEEEAEEERVCTVASPVEQNGEASLKFNCGTMLSALPSTSRCM